MRIGEIVHLTKKDICENCMYVLEEIHRGYPYWCKAFKLPLDKDESGILKNYKCLENREVK